MIKNNKIKIIISSLLILLPLILINISKIFIILPIFLLIVQWACIFAESLDKSKKNTNSKIFNIVLFIIPFMSLYFSAIFLGISQGKEFDVLLCLQLLFGIMMIVLGNFLPKTQQNFTMGIKVKWTLANEENWFATHRFAGKLWVISGFIILFSVFVPKFISPYILFSVISISVILPLLFSYIYYKKQVNEGKAPQKAVVNYKNFKGNSKILSTMGIIILVLVISLMFTGNIEITCDDRSLTVNATYWSESVIPYDEITSVEYRESDNPGMRTFGYGSPKILLGSFKNDEFGSYTRYTYTKSAIIVIKTNDEVFVISGKNSNDTKSIYEVLQEKIGRS